METKTPEEILIHKIWDEFIEIQNMCSMVTQEEQLNKSVEHLKSYLESRLSAPSSVEGKPELNKDEFIEIAKIVELCVQNDPDYKGSITTGYFTERFNNAFKTYKNK